MASAVTHRLPASATFRAGNFTTTHRPTPALM
jgi:hypothetical protein